MTFKQLRESKAVGTLFHYTKFENLSSMLHDEDPLVLKSHNETSISTSRNSNLPISGGHNDQFKHHDVRIDLDGDKISQHHKIRAIAGLTDNEKDLFSLRHNDKFRVNRKSGEAEEAILKHPIDIKPFIKHIHIVGHRDNEQEYTNHVKPKLNNLGIKHTYSRSFSSSKVENLVYTDRDKIFLIEFVS